MTRVGLYLVLYNTLECITATNNHDFIFLKTGSLDNALREFSLA